MLRTSHRTGSRAAAARNRAHTPILIEAVKRLASARSLARIESIVLEAARALTGAEGATFVLRSEDACLYAAESSVEPLWKGRRFPVDQCAAGWAMQNSRALAVPDVYADDRVPHDAYRSTFVKSLVMTPIGEVTPVGALGVYWAESHSAAPDELDSLAELADAARVAMDNARLWEDLEMRVVDRTRQVEEANATVRELLDEATERGNDLRRAVEHYRDLMNVLAHEVRGPLTAGDLMLDELLQDFGLDGQMKENVEDARRCVAEAVRIVQYQLDRAKFEAGSMRPDLEPVDVGEVVDGLAGMVRALRRGEEVQLRTVVPESLPPLRTDPHILSQVLRNLMSNALKFTNEGSVTLSVSYDSTTSRFRFEVSDTGVGIAESDRRRVFEAFWQVSENQTSDRAGTGLGLPLSRSLAGALGGTLVLAEGTSRGSTFVLTLPAAGPLPD